MFSEILFILSIVIVLAYFLNRLRNQRFHYLMSKIPGPIGYPLIGNLNMLWFLNCHENVNRLTHVFSALSHLYRDHGIYRFETGPIQGVMIFRNELVQDFLKNNDNLEKPFEYQILYDWLGKGLLINDNPLLWKQRRKLLTPAFHFKIIDQFLPVFNEKSQILVQNLKGFVGAKTFDLAPFIFSCTLDAIADTTLGVPLNSQQNQNLDYFEAVHDMNDIFFHRLERPWLFPDIIFFATKMGQKYQNCLKVLHGLTRKVINERKHIILENKRNVYSEKSNKKRKLALLDQLLDIHLNDNNSLTLEDIREEVDTFMFAGHDTSACCLIWTFYLLGSHPEVQHKLYEELQSVVTKDEDINSEHIRQLPYLEAVIKESLRIYPPVPNITRKITHEFKLGEYIIPKGVSIYFLISRLHQDPNIFPDPLQFRPERFLENQHKDVNPFCFTPFSAGARSCIGQKFALNEIKIIVSKVILNYSLESLEDRNHIIISDQIVSKPLNGIQIKIIQRN